MIRVRMGLLIPALLLAGLVFGVGRPGYAASNAGRPVVAAFGQGHVGSTGWFVYTDWDDHHHPGDRDDWDHDHHRWGGRDWDHGYRGWREHRWHHHHHYRDHDEHHHWGGDNDDHDRGRWYTYGRYWNGNPGWYGNQYAYPGFYYFGWSFHQ